MNPCVPLARFIFKVLPKFYGADLLQSELTQQLENTSSGITFLLISVFLLKYSEDMTRAFKITTFWS